ncbi:unnamed protein product, partial [Symbiodinium necroappetens]
DGICGVGLEEAVKKLQDAGYLSNPSRCPSCGRGNLTDLFRYGKNQDLVGRKCTQWDCRVRFNALNFSRALPDHLGRSFRADQLYAAIKMYTDSGVARPPTPAEAGKTLGLSSKGPRRLFAALLEKEAAAGKQLSQRLVLRNEVELDCTSVRTLRIAPRSHAYAGYIEKWLAKHPGERRPQHFLHYVRVLGATQRGTNKLVLRLLPVKLVAQQAKPPVESVDEVLDSGIFNRIAQGTKLYSDGAFAYPAAV